MSYTKQGGLVARSRLRTNRPVFHIFNNKLWPRLWSRRKCQVTLAPATEVIDPTAASPAPSPLNTRVKHIELVNQQSVSSVISEYHWSVSLHDCSALLLLFLQPWFLTDENTIYNHNTVVRESALHEMLWYSRPIFTWQNHRWRIARIPCNELRFRTTMTWRLINYEVTVDWLIVIWFLTNYIWNVGFRPLSLSQQRISLARTISSCSIYTVGGHYSQNILSVQVIYHYLL